MKAEKQIIFKLELEGEETKLFSEALFKILSVEKTISPNVMRSLNDQEVKLLEEIKNSIEK